MNGEVDGVRLLPWTGDHGQPCLLLTDGTGSASRLADRIENAQLGLGERLLGQARKVLAEDGARGSELGLLSGQLADALSDALLIAESRGARLGGQRLPLSDGVLAALPPMTVVHEVLTHLPAALRAYGLLVLPGRDLASAPAARHFVRDSARLWDLPSGVADDLETITAELVANVLEHSDSRTLTLTCALAAGTATVSVTDEGNGRTSRTFASPREPGADQEHGRGLLITAALATRWGTRQSGTGLTVWADVVTDVPPKGAAG